MHLLAGVDVAHDLAARDDRADGDLALEERFVSRDQRVLGNHLALDLAVDADSALEAEHALELGAFAEECGDLRLLR